MLEFGKIFPTDDISGVLFLSLMVPLNAGTPAAYPTEKDICTQRSLFRRNSEAIIDEISVGCFPSRGWNLRGSYDGESLRRYKTNNIRPQNRRMPNARRMATAL